MCVTTQHNPILCEKQNTCAKKDNEKKTDMRVNGKKNFFADAVLGRIHPHLHSLGYVFVYAKRVEIASRNVSLSSKKL